MPEIHVLDSKTIDLIAAGEVVERPASVVKELVENALDAGANAITVEIKEGGIGMIRVTDNGCGMSADQVRKAFMRHATSKIEKAEDLSGIHSLGFRGEALSSIAAVAQVELITKTADSLTGVRLCLEGGRETSLEEIGAPEGTTFLMRNLFYNTPARRKFLKQAYTEGGYVTELMEHLALSRPDVSIRFVIGTQPRFHTSGNGNLKEVIYRIYGREIANALVPIQWEKKGMKLEGYLGQPTLVRSNRNYEIYFLNGRFIKSTIVAKSLEEGFKGYLMQHKFPFCVLHFSLDPELVDVNVHPTKMDVRFWNPFLFSEFLTEAVGNTLKSREMIPKDNLRDPKQVQQAVRAERESIAKEAVPEPFERTRRGDSLREEIRYGVEKSPVWERVRKQPASKETTEEDDFFIETSEVGGAVNPKDETVAETKNGGAYTSDAAGTAKPENGSSAEAKDGAAGGSEAVGTAKAEGENSDQSESEELAAEMSAGEVGAVPSGPKPRIQYPTMSEPGRKELVNRLVLEASAPEPIIEGEQLNFLEEKLLSQNNRDLFRVIGQVFDTYWMFEYDNKLCILDQHAAHEKVKYERLIKRYRDKEILTQNLMPPIVLSLSGQEEAVLKEYSEVFTDMGFEVESFGGTEYCLRSVPVDLYGYGEKELFLAVLDELEAGVAQKSAKVIDRVIATMACKSAVKGNTRISQAEAEELIDELLTLENPYHCPHGRPTIFTISKYEMERKFKRVI